MKAAMNPERDQMPAEVATALLTSNQKQTNTFRKVCKQARERIVAPVSRSTDAPLIPATFGQRLLRRLRRLNAKQLCTWARRVQRKGERLQDARDDESVRLVEVLSQQLEQIDTLGQAIKSELDRRANGGKLIT